MDKQQGFIDSYTFEDMADAHHNPDTTYTHESINSCGNTYPVICTSRSLSLKFKNNKQTHTPLDDTPRTRYTIVPSHEDHLNNYQRVITVSTLNLNDDKQRFVLLSILALIWCIPTLIVSVDFYANSHQHDTSTVEETSPDQNKFHFTALFIIFLSDCFLFLCQVMEFRHYMLSNMIGTMFIVGGILHFISLILFMDTKCHHLKDNTLYCYCGYIGAYNLGTTVPLLMGIDVIKRIMNRKYIRTMTLAFILWFTTMFTVIALSKYGNGFDIDFDAYLFRVISVGWWLLCISCFMGMTEIFIAVYILNFHRFKFDRGYMRAINLVIGFMLIVSVSFILIEKDGCITGNVEIVEDAMFCYHRLTYILVGLSCVLSYELQTLSS